MPQPLVSLVVPAYNEERTIAEVVRRVKALPLRTEVVVVDDGSTDGTAAVLASLDGVTVLRQDANRGKGAAVRAGIAATEGEVVVVQDADLEYDPRDLPTLVQPLLEGRADVVYGTRLRRGEPHGGHLHWHYAANRLLSLLTSLLYNTQLTDMEVGYKAFRGDLIRSLHLVSDDFRFEPEVTAKVLRIPGVRVEEVPVSYSGRTFAEGKKITWRDGVKAVAALIRFRFGPR